MLLPDFDTAAAVTCSFRSCKGAYNIWVEVGSPLMGPTCTTPVDEDNSTAGSSTPSMASDRET